MNKRKVAKELPPAPSFEELGRMHDALFATADGGLVSPAMCRAINSALIYLGARLEADIRAKRRGAPIAWERLAAATVAMELMDMHDATAKSAAQAGLAAIRGNRNAVGWQRVERLCRSLRKRKNPMGGKVGDGAVIVSPTLAKSVLPLIRKGRRQIT